MSITTVDYGSLEIRTHHQDQIYCLDPLVSKPTAERPKPMRLSKQGDQYLRWLLVAGAMASIRHAKRRGTTNLPWLADLIASKPTKVAAVALANKMARIAWAVLRQGGTYQKPEAFPAA